jgi:release factor glutamine methyltransferase
MTYEEFWHPLQTLYDTGEAKAIARTVLEVCFNLTMTDILCGKVTQLSANDQNKLEEILQRLLTGEPVQYVLGEADFGGKTFLVEPGVLIPRPETYELCEWVLEERGINILDIGTGSGCIAITLALGIPEAKVTAWDISDKALKIAAENAKRANVNVSFEQVDILAPLPFTLHPSPLTYDIIVSNPPYILNKERARMERNVLDYEPELALFVPDDDPLLFYHAIARYAIRVLKPDGRLFFEINPLCVNDLQQMLNNEGFSHTEVRNDQFDKQRFIKSWR